MDARPKRGDTGLKGDAGLSAPATTSLPSHPFSNPAIKDDSTKTTTASAVIQAYVQMIQEQPDLKLNALPSLPSHQQTARDHAKTWTTSILPSMIKTNADIIDYANQFQSFYAVLVQYAKDVSNPDSRQKLVEGLKVLHDNIQGKYDAAKSVTSQLTTFHGNLAADDKNFQSDYNVALVKIEGDDGEIKALSKELDSVQKAMNKDIGLMAGGAIAVVGGIALIAFGAVSEIPSGGASTALIGAGVLVMSGGVIAETLGASDYDKKITEQKNIQEKLATDKQEMAGLKTAKGQLDGFLSAVSSAVTASQALVEGWQALGADLSETIDAIDRVDPSITPDFIVAELNTANSDWKVALDQAIHLQANGQVPSKLYKNLQDAFKETRKG